MPGAAPLIRVASVALGLRLVDRGVGGGVDDHVRLRLAHDRARIAVGIGQVERGAVVATTSPSGRQRRASSAADLAAARRSAGSSIGTVSAGAERRAAPHPCASTMRRALERPARCRAPGSFQSDACARARARSSRSSCTGPRRRSESTRKPCANPAGIHSMRWFAADSVDADPLAEGRRARGAGRPPRRRSRPRARAPASPAAGGSGSAGRAARCAPSATGCPARTRRRARSRSRKTRRL